MKKRLLIYFLAILAVQSIYGQKLILPTPYNSQQSTTTTNCPEIWNVYPFWYQYFP